MALADFKVRLVMRGRDFQHAGAEVERDVFVGDDRNLPLLLRLIERERALDLAFAGQQITPPTLASLTAQIGETQGELRAVHLKYHLTTAELLTPHQKHRYVELRGYR